MDAPISGEHLLHPVDWGKLAPVRSAGGLEANVPRVEQDMSSMNTHAGSYRVNSTRQFSGDVVYIPTLQSLHVRTGEIPQDPPQPPPRWC
jgi:hypothetical protein